MNWIFLLFHKARKSVSLNMGNLIVKSIFFDKKINCEIYFLWHRLFWVTLYFPHVYFPHMWFFRRVMRTGSNDQQPMYWAPDFLSVSSSFFWSYHCHLYEIHLTYLYFLAYLFPLYREHFHKNWKLYYRKNFRMKKISLNEWSIP